MQGSQQHQQGWPYIGHKSKKLKCGGEETGSQECLQKYLVGGVHEIIHVANDPTFLKSFIKPLMQKY